MARRFRAHLSLDWKWLVWVPTFTISLGVGKYLWKQPKTTLYSSGFFWRQRDCEHSCRKDGTLRCMKLEPVRDVDDGQKKQSILRRKYTECLVCHWGYPWWHVGTLRRLSKQVKPTERGCGKPGDYWDHVSLANWVRQRWAAMIKDFNAFKDISILLV